MPLPATARSGCVVAPRYRSQAHHHKDTCDRFGQAGIRCRVKISDDLVSKLQATVSGREDADAIAADQDRYVSGASGKLLLEGSSTRGCWRRSYNPSNQTLKFKAITFRKALEKRDDIAILVAREIQLRAKTEEKRDLGQK
eukprot:544996-Rhodomonas_salina.3